MIGVDVKAKGFEQPLLDNIGFNLNCGELVAIVGPSGCGKSTLLNIIAGLDTDFSGEIVGSTGRPKIAYMFQEPRLLPWRTLRQNLEIICPRSDCIDQLFELVGLADQQHKYPMQVSLGMARRVALLRCFLTDPELLLMDEPLVSLDEASSRVIRQQLRQMRSDKPQLAILYVTHDLDEACEMADRVIVLGGTPARIIDQQRQASPADIRRLLER